MNRRTLRALGIFAWSAGSFACSSSNSTPDTSKSSTTLDAGEPADAGSDAGGDSSTGAGTPPTEDGGAGITTIAAAIEANVTAPITVQAIVTAEHGSIPSDVSEWYIEDPDGGPHSGVVVYCDPDKTTACPTIRAPGRWSLVRMTGTLQAYKGQMEFIPTAQTVLSDAGAPPPVATVNLADVGPTGTSEYRGVLVKLAQSTLTVTDVTPAPLRDTSCTTVLASDAGASDAGSDGGGLLSCASLCEPPAYSGFVASDSSGNAVNIEASFFATDPLQSSPECLTQPGVTPVTMGMTFSNMQGVLDFDPYAQQQQISPVTPADYQSP